MGTPGPGWYESEGRHRYWDGARWTDRYFDEEQTAPEPPPPTGVPYDPAMDAKAAPDLQPKKNNVGLWAACGGCILVPILVIALSFAFSSGKENKPYDPNNASEAIAQCEDLVTSQLKAPSTASFDSAAARNGTAEWTVTGTVDAQNGFGAQIRSTYQCSMRIKGGKIERRLDYFG